MLQFTKQGIVAALLVAGSMGQNAARLMNTSFETVTPENAELITARHTVADWETLARGLERRIYIPNGDVLSELIALRIDPKLFTFRAHYQPESPLTMAQWRDALPEASAFVNANFFELDQRVIGLLIADGIAHGEAINERGGFFGVNEGEITLRYNPEHPYAGEPFDQAVQGYPMLVHEGKAIYKNESRVARRTVIAIDDEGRIIVFATPLLGITLKDLSAFLVESDLNIYSAFNLDGGGSTMMYADQSDFNVVSLDAVPAVLAVYPQG